MAFAIVALNRIIIVRPDLQMPAVSKFIDGSGPVWAGSLFPFLFITIAAAPFPDGIHSFRRGRRRR